MIQITQIHSARWANPEHTMVLLVADTNTGNSEQISTPYSQESIVWQWVQDFPAEQIGEYVEPQLAVPPTDVSVEKLKAFLASNLDVAAMLQAN